MQQIKSQTLDFVLEGNKQRIRSTVDEGILSMFNNIYKEKVLTDVEGGQRSDKMIHEINV